MKFNQIGQTPIHSKGATDHLNLKTTMLVSMSLLQCNTIRPLLRGMTFTVTIMVSASERSGQERILEAYHHLHRQALGLPSLLSLVDRVGSPPMRVQDRGGGGASGGPTISRPKAVGRATASIAFIVTQYLFEAQLEHQYHEIVAVIRLDFRGNCA